MYIVKQVPFDQQESPRNWEYADKLVLVRGNNKFQTTDDYDQIERWWSDWLDDWILILEEEKGLLTHNPDWAIHEFLDFERLTGTHGTSEQWKKKLEDLRERDVQELKEVDYCTLLELLGGGNWNYTTLHGSSQGDWVTCCYDASEYSREDLTRIEADFFNTGTEWIYCSDEEEYCTSIYCYGFFTEKIRQELAEALCVQPEEIEMHEFTQYVKTPVWRIV